MTNLNENFDHLYKVISSSNFLKKQSLGGEIPFFISAYEAKDENEVSVAVRLLQNKLNAAGVKVLELNLYDIACDILEAKGGIERMFRVEQRKSKDKFLRALQSSLNIHQVLMPRIKEMIDETEAKVYFLTGIGACYPFVRSHNVLNNLQNVAKDCPTVAFFPGEYNGHSLNLFGLMKDDNYYRAFNINTIKA
ncbi:DUF1788 domain-containing protein [Christiangramia echinicola]|uniref:DUF1788 domain-containing protein n=1 Tax=Christiangramia echinicola TaxID=279359 RepID=A0A1H1RJY9_9FLAO|nr:DUF1788 domain-containing protein [Christiangramia echinicola]SDS36010.1 protein of unknown function [Christiangramia echinicola]